MVPEVLATRIACSTFNFMVQEERPVAAVLFPPGSEARQEQAAEQLTA
jgi:hypothetical protein